MSRGETWTICGKVCIVTGANSGIGRETALQLLQLGAGRVIMACRNMDTGLEAWKYIRQKAGINSDADAERRLCLRHLDLASLSSVRAFANDILASEKQLNVIVNNAGLYPSWSKAVTRDSFEMAFGTNHLGHFLMNKLLLDLLKKSAPSRIIAVSSNAYAFTWPWGFHYADPNFEGKGSYNFVRAYGQSKLANMLYARELDKRLNSNDPSGVTVYSLHPGLVPATNIFQNSPWIVRTLIRNMLKCMFIHVDETAGAKTSVYCATEPGIEINSGKYFRESKVSEPLAIGKDDMAAIKLWELSEQLISD